VNRGDIFLATLNPVRGSEQAGTRPVLILQTAPLNSFLRTVIVLPFTSNLRWKSFAFCVFVARGEGGLTSDSVALCHQIRVVDKLRLIRQLGRISDVTMAKIEQAIRLTIGT